MFDVAFSAMPDRRSLQKLQRTQRSTLVKVSNRIGARLANFLGMALVTVPSAEVVIRCAIKVHRELGPGLFESIYLPCLVHEVEKEGLRVSQQVKVPLTWDGLLFDCAFRADLIVENELIVEVKSVEHLTPLHHKQLLTYLRLTAINKGLLLNFNATLMKDGIKSVVLTP